MAKKFYTRNQAAQILNVSPSTISNYIKNGLLTNCAPVKEDRRQEVYVKASEVEALRPQVTDIESLKQTISEYKEKLKEEQENIIKDYKTLMDFSQSRRYFFFDMGHILECLFAIIDPLQDREKDVLTLTLAGEPLESIAARHNLSRERIRQIVVKATKKIDRHCLQNASLLYKKCFEENASLRKQNELIKKAYEEEHLRLSKYENSTNFVENMGATVLTYDDIKTIQVLTSPVLDYGLTVRAYNCLKSNDIELIAELVSYKKHEVMRFRNLGRKSLYEIEALLEKLGLSFGMDLSKYGFTLSVNKSTCHSNWIASKELIELLEKVSITQKIQLKYD